MKNIYSYNYTHISPPWVAEIKILDSLLCMKLDSRVGVGLKGRHSDMGHRHPNWCLNCHVKCLTVGLTFHTTFSLFFLRKLEIIVISSLITNAAAVASC